MLKAQGARGKAQGFSAGILASGWWRIRLGENAGRME